MTPAYEQAAMVLRELQERHNAQANDPRHRLFESNLPIVAPPCDHASQPIVLGVYGTGGSDSGRAKRGGGGGVKVSGKAAADAMGIDWTTDQKRLSQMIPPAYTEHIGRQLIAQLSERA